MLSSLIFDYLTDLFLVLDEKFRVGLMAATHHVAERLKLLLGNYSIPPKLPAILFGKQFFYPFFLLIFLFTLSIPHPLSLTISL